VGFRIGNETFGVRIGSVREIVRVTESPQFQCSGHHRGRHQPARKIIPVMDLRKRFGQAEIAPDKKKSHSCRGARHQAPRLIVNSASEVLKIPPSEIEPPGTVFADGESSYVTRRWKTQRPPIILLDISKLLHRPEFKRLEEAAEIVATPS